MEADVKHIIARYPYSKFKILAAAFQSSAPAGMEIAGLCIKPIRNSPGVDSGLFTNGFEIVLVGWNPPASSGGGGTTPGTLHMFHASNYVKPNPNAPDQLTIQQNALTDYVDLDALGAWVQFQYYDNTSEFEYAFIDIQTFGYLAGETSTSFYNNAGNQPLHPATNVPFNPVTERGLLLSRAFITLHDGTGYKKFRGLRMYPYPEPKLPVNAAGRNSLSYYLGPTCPPYWHDEGVTTAATTTGGAGSGGSTPAGAVTPVMLSTSQVIDPPHNQEDCNCVINQIDKVRLHAELIEQGVIPKEPPPVFRIKRWPWILLAAFILLLAVVGIVEVLRGDVFKSQ